jgi:segregation and condensation protein B
VRFEDAKNIIETLIFAASKPVSAKDIAEVLGVEEGVVRGLIQDITEEYESTRALRIRYVAGGYEMCTRIEYEQYLEALNLPPRPSPLSNAALETVAIIAYKQPVTRVEIEDIRGVRVDRVISTLLERDLIEEAGRKECVGRPILYRTTDEFLRYFGLKNLHELPEVYDFNGVEK